MKVGSKLSNCVNIAVAPAAVDEFALSLGITPNTVAAGTDVTFAGTLTNHGTGVSGAAVTVTAYSTDSTCTTPVGWGPFTATVDASGHYATAPASTTGAPAGVYYYKASSMGVVSGCEHFTIGVPEAPAVDEATGDVTWDYQGLVTGTVSFKANATGGSLDYTNSNGSRSTASSPRTGRSTPTRPSSPARSPPATPTTPTSTPAPTTSSPRLSSGTSGSNGDQIAVLANSCPPYVDYDIQRGLRHVSGGRDRHRRRPGRPLTRSHPSWTNGGASRPRCRFGHVHNRRAGGGLRARRYMTCASRVPVTPPLRRVQADSGGPWAARFRAAAGNRLLMRDSLLRSGAGVGPTERGATTPHRF